jgi:hypothetical protein
LRVPVKYLMGRSVCVTLLKAGRAIANGPERSTFHTLQSSHAEAHACSLHRRSLLQVIHVGRSAHLKRVISHISVLKVLANAVIIVILYSANLHAETGLLTVGAQVR